MVAGCSAFPDSTECVSFTLCADWAWLNGMFRHARTRHSPGNVIREAFAMAYIRFLLSCTECGVAKMPL
jgi:hypothetical protein